MPSDFCLLGRKKKLYRNAQMKLKIAPSRESNIYYFVLQNHHFKIACVHVFSSIFVCFVFTLVNTFHSLLLLLIETLIPPCITQTVYISLAGEWTKKWTMWIVLSSMTVDFLSPVVLAFASVSVSGSGSDTDTDTVTSPIRLISCSTHICFNISHQKSLK